MDQLKDFGHKEQINPWGIGLTLLALVVLSFFIDISSLKIWVEKAGAWGPLIFILLKISTLVIAPLSGSALYPLVGVLFGFWPGLLYVVIGDIAGCSINFYLSRILGRKAVTRWLSDKEDHILNNIIDHIGDRKGFFQASLSLFVLPELLSYAAGLSRLRYRDFLLVLIPFEIIPASILVFIGSILDLQNQSVFIKVMLPIVGVIAIIAGGSLFLRSVKKRRKR